MNVEHLLHTAGAFLEKNSPQILTGLGVAGVISTAVMTGRATVKACDIINAELKKRPKMSTLDPDRPGCLKTVYPSVSWQECIKLTWKYYIPPFFMGATSIACILGAQSVNTKRNAALASLYSLTKSTLDDYQEKVKERFGEKKEELVRGDVAQKRMDAKPASGEHIIETGRGETLFFDSMSGRYFKHDMETIRRIINDLNHDLIGAMWVPLNDLYYAMGLEGIDLGEQVGWTVDELIDIKFTPKFADDGKTPCVAMSVNPTLRSIKTANWGGL